MIVDLDLSNNSFTKLLALIHDANELIEEIDFEDKESYSHRLSYRAYKIIKQNDSKEFNQMLSHFLSELNLLAMRTPYSNQNTLLLIDAFHTITSDIHYYSDLNDLFPDIKFIYIPEFSWDDYRKQQSQPQHNSVNEEKLSRVKTNDFDFDFDEDVLSKDFNNEQTPADAKQLNDDFDFSDEAATIANQSVIPVGDTVVRKQNTINEKEVERRAMAAAEAVKANTIIRKDIEDLQDDEIDSFDFGAPEETTDNKTRKNYQEREFKPWVLPLFTFVGLTLIGSLLYGFFN